MANKGDVTIEKETIIKEVRGEKLEKVTIRVHIVGDGNTRSIVFTPAQFKKFQKDVLEVKF